MGVIYKNSVIYTGGGGGSDEHVELTQAQYDALSPAEKSSGKVFFITDGQTIDSQVDQSYDATSENAQSGKAVAEAVMKAAFVSLGPKNVASGTAEAFYLTNELLPSDLNELIAIIPISVMPASTWGTTLPALFSSVSMAARAVNVRAYVTGEYNPTVVILYR